MEGTKRDEYKRQSHYCIWCFEWECSMTLRSLPCPGPIRSRPEDLKNEFKKSLFGPTGCCNIHIVKLRGSNSNLKGHSDIMQHVKKFG